MVDNGSFSDQIHMRTVQAQQFSVLQTAIAQDEAAVEFQESIENAFNPVAMRNHFERLETRIRKTSKDESTERAEKTDEADIQIEAIEKTSQQFEEKNPELLAKSLLSLRSRISKNDSNESILKMILESYPDYSLADEALDFLIQTSDPELAERLLQIKNQLNETNGREIRAGKNIMTQAQIYSKQNLGSPTSLRDLYRDFTGNPREPSTLFAELAHNYTYAKMQTVIAFVLHALGQDLKSKGPSIEKGELHRLLTEARSLQAILGVYRFFQSRMPLIFSSFDKQNLALPDRINFENLAKAFVKLLLERYPSSEKILQIGSQLGLQEEVIAEIIIFSQMKEAIRQISTRLYRSEQHRQDLLATFLDTLEDLEDQLDEQEEKEEEEEES